MDLQDLTRRRHTLQQLGPISAVTLSKVFRGHSRSTSETKKQFVVVWRVYVTYIYEIVLTLQSDTDLLRVADTRDRCQAWSKYAYFF